MVKTQTLESVHNKKSSGKTEAPSSKKEEQKKLSNYQKNQK